MRARSVGARARLAAIFDVWRSRQKVVREHVRAPTLRLTAMFSSLGLFRNLPCPDPHNCTRGKQCVFSHNKDTILPKPLRIPLDQHKISEPSTSTSIPAKRPAIPTPPNSASRVPSKLTKSALGATSEPPRKFQKLGPGQKPLAKPTASYTPVHI